MTAMDLRERRFLVTGANTGIGRTTAEALAARGGSVILAARSQERTKPVLDGIKERYPESDVEFLLLDLADLAAVRRSAEVVRQSGRPLDVLINNAGLAGIHGGLTKEGFEITVGTNHIGPFLFTSLLLPRLCEAPQGRIVNVASVAHQKVRHMVWGSLERPPKGLTGLRAYALSKLMNVLHAKELARRCAGTSLTTYSLHPGVVASDIWREVPSLIRAVMKLFMISNEEGAKTSVYCATDPALSTVSGRYYEKCAERLPSPLAQDENLARELYDRTEQAIAAVGRLQR